MVHLLVEATDPEQGHDGKMYGLWRCNSVEGARMVTPDAKPDRLNAFSDAVFAVIITVLVLDLRPPESGSLAALVSLWPAGVSYTVSYLFVAIVWVNHHYLLRFAELVRRRVIWGNFAHLFSISLVPFATAWIADSRLAAIPVALYAGIFVLVNVTYIVLCWEIVDRPRVETVPPRERQTMRRRSLATLGLFAAAAILALAYPIGGMALICCCLVLYLRPEASGVKT
jgi:uncharacterized membrane protein